MGIRCNNKGFSLLELIISLGIIGIVVIGFMTAFTSGFSWVFAAGHNNTTNFNDQGNIDNNIAARAVTANETITANFPGVPAITVAGGITTVGKLTAFVPGAVPPPPVAVTSVTVTPTAIQINVGDVLSLSHVVNPANASNPAVTWTSSNDLVATVNNGVVTGIGYGSAVIRVSADEDPTIYAECTVTIQDISSDMNSITVSPAAISFSSSTYDYDLDNGTNNKAFISATHLSPATLTIFGDVVSSGEIKTVNLQKGVNTVLVTVQEPGKLLKTYTLKITRG